MQYREFGPFASLAMLCSGILALCLAGFVLKSEPHASGLSFETRVVAQGSAPVDVRACSSSFDGSRVEANVQLFNSARKPVSGYSVEWRAYDRLGHERSVVVVDYNPAKPVPPRSASTGRSSIDIIAGVKAASIDHVTCRTAIVEFGDTVWRSGDGTGRGGTQ